MLAKYCMPPVIIGVAICLIACANKQEEAMRLEREIMSQDTALSLAVISRDSQRSADTTVATAPSADAILPSEDLAVSSIGEASTSTEGEPEPAVDNTAKDSVMALVAAQSSKTVEPQPGQSPTSGSESGVTPAGAMPRREVPGNYTVQIAASISEAFALELVDLNSRRGYEPYVDTKIISNVSWYRVRVGHFDTFARAAGKRDELINKYSLQAWVDNIPK